MYGSRTRNEIRDATNSQLCPLDMCLGEWPHSNCSVARVTALLSLSVVALFLFLFLLLAVSEMNHSMWLIECQVCHTWTNDFHLWCFHKNINSGWLWYPKVGQVETFIFGNWCASFKDRRLGPFSSCIVFLPSSLLIQLHPSHPFKDTRHNGPLRGFEMPNSLSLRALRI